MARPRTLTDEERKERQKAACKKWCEANREKLKEIRRRYYEKNKEECDRRTREWGKNHPESIKAINQRWLDKNPNYFKEYREKKRKERISNGTNHH